MTRIEGPPVGRISEPIQKGGRIKGVPVLKPPNIALAREAGEKGFIQKLSIGQQEVIRRRYSIDGNPPLSLSVIGDYLHLTREEVRQLETRGFRNIQRLKEGKPPLVKGGCHRTDIDVSEVIRLYIEENKTSRQIERLFMCGHMTVLRRLHANRITTRPASRKK